MQDSGKKSPVMRDFIEYNEKGEPIVLSSNVGNAALHPGIKNDGESAQAAPGGSKPAATSSEPSLGSMRFFCDIQRLISPLKLQTADA